MKSKYKKKLTANDVMCELVGELRDASWRYRPKGTTNTLELAIINTLEYAIRLVANSEGVDNWKVTYRKDGSISKIIEISKTADFNIVDNKGKVIQSNRRVMYG